MRLSNHPGLRLSLLLAALCIGLGATPGEGQVNLQPNLIKDQSPEYAHAVQALRDSNFDLAIQLGSAFLDKNAADASAHMLLALAYVGKGANQRAMDQAGLATGNGGNDAVVIYRNLADTYRQTGRFYLALACLKRAQAIADSPELAHELALVYLTQGHAASARSLLEKALPAVPDYLNLSRACLTLGDYDATRMYAQKILDADSKNSGALLLRGTGELLANDHDAAEATFRLLKTVKDDAGVVGHYLGLIALVRGNYDAALTEMDGLLKVSPKLREAQLISALCWQQKGKYPEARRSAAAVLATYPNDAIAQLVMASAWLGEKQQAQARSALGKADALLIEFSTPCINTLRIVETWDAAKAGRLALDNYLLTEGMARSVQNLIASQTDSSTAEAPFFAIINGRAKVAAGGRPEAVAIYTALTRQQDILVTPWVELAQLAQADGNAAQAVEYLLEAKKRGGDSVRFNLIAGDLAYRIGRADLAEAHFRRVLALDSKSAVGNNQLAWILGEQGKRYADALPFAVTAQQLDPANPNTIDTLAWINFQLGNHAEAARLYEPLLKSLPRDPTTLYHMAQVCQKTGRTVAAASLLEKALDLSQDFADAVPAEMELVSLWPAS